MFARRNSLTLAVVWIIFLSVGSFWYFRDANRLLGALSEQAETRETLKRSRTEIGRLTVVETAHDTLNSQWQKAPKRIISADEPSFTLAYLNWILTANKLNIYYDFVLNSKNESQNVIKFTYTLTGEGSYDDINRLIWHLTYEPILYQIQSLNLRVGAEEGFRRFTMTLEGYSVKGQASVDENFSESAGGVALGYKRQGDIFRAIAGKRVARSKTREVNALPKKKPGEIDISKASLKAVTPNAVFISEAGGPLKQVRVGDRVYLGNLVAINQQKNQAEFMISKRGRAERVILTIDGRN